MPVRKESPQLLKNYFWRGLTVLVGIALIGFGIALYVRAELGVDPWTILTLGLSKTAGITAGRASQIVGLLLIVFCLLILKRKPGLATLANFFLVGLILDCLLGILPEVGGIIHLQILFIVIAVFAIGFGSAIYINGNLGEGPIELAMVGISEKLKIKPGLVRILLDVFAAVLGYILGGPVGIGSIIGIAGVGPAVQLALNIMQRCKKEELPMANSYFDKELAGIIDHTLLKPEATPADIRKLCQEAREYQFCSVCVNPVFVPLAKQELAGSPVKVCTVIGFPLGATSAFAKAAEARDAAAMGADELDMVIRIGALKSGLYQEVHRDIAAVVDASGGRLVKVIIETALLTDEEKKTACKIAVEAGANFVKTSTGFSRGGATVEDVKLMRAMVGSEIGVKASGGIRDRETALRMVEAGASRLGLSAGVAVVTGSAGQSSY